MPSLLRNNERVIAWPDVTPVLPQETYLNAQRMNVLSGQFFAAMDPPPITKGGVFLPSGGDGITRGSAATQLRADAATVLRLGPIPDRNHPKYDLALSMHRQLSVGDHVVLVPYLNRFAVHSGVGDAHIAGLDGDEWIDTTIARQIEGGWELLGNWILCRVKWTQKPMAANYRGRPKRSFEDWGTVLARGNDASVDIGQDILLLGKGEIRPYDSKFFVCPRGPFGDDVVLFREASWQRDKYYGLEYVNRVGAVIHA